MEIITEKNIEIFEQWYKDAANQTLATLPQFMNHVLNDYVHDYGTICKAIGACSVAAAWAADASRQGGITGFQAGAVMWEFIRNWNYTRNKCGLKIVDMDKMLYPQYSENFDKTISMQEMETLTTEAKKLLEADEDSNVHPKVKAHWQSIAVGIPPFGYRVVGTK